MNSKLTTAVRMFLGFSIAPLGLLLLALYGLSNLATLRDQATTIVNQDWPKIEPIMQIATGVRDNARNTRDLLLNKDNVQARESLQATKQRITQAMDTLGPLLYLPKGQALFRQLKTHREAYVAAFSEVLALVQQGQMEQVFPFNLTIHFSEHTGMFGQSFGFRHRQETMLVDRVLVILIELHQSAHTREGRHQLLQQMRPMHGVQCPRRTGPRQNREEGAAGLGRVELLD